MEKIKNRGNVCIYHQICVRAGVVFEKWLQTDTSHFSGKHKHPLNAYHRLMLFTVFLIITFFMAHFLKFISQFNLFTEVRKKVRTEREGGKRIS